MISRISTGILIKKDKAACCSDEVTYQMQKELTETFCHLPRGIQDIPTE